MADPIPEGQSIKGITLTGQKDISFMQPCEFGLLNGANIFIWPNSCSRQTQDKIRSLIYQWFITDLCTRACVWPIYYLLPVCVPAQFYLCSIAPYDGVTGVFFYFIHTSPVSSTPL